MKLLANFQDSGSYSDYAELFFSKSRQTVKAKVQNL
jgi:hypothetical protein